MKYQRCINIELSYRNLNFPIIIIITMLLVTRLPVNVVEITSSVYLAMHMHINHLLLSRIPLCQYRINSKQQCILLTMYPVVQVTRLSTQAPVYFYNIETLSLFWITISHNNYY